MDKFDLTNHEVLDLLFEYWENFRVLFRVPPESIILYAGLSGHLASNLAIKRSPKLVNSSLT